MLLKACQGLISKTSWGDLELKALLKCFKDSKIRLGMLNAPSHFVRAKAKILSSSLESVMEQLFLLEVPMHLVGTQSSNQRVLKRHLLRFRWNKRTRYLIEERHWSLLKTI